MAQGTRPKPAVVWFGRVPWATILPRLAKLVPQDAIPELIPVADYDGLTLMGELALCLQRLVEA